MALTVRTVVFGLVFEYTVTVFLSSPSVSRFFGLNTTSILPFAPGMMGSLGQFGTVQPQEPFAFSINNGSVPVFTNSKAWLFSDCALTLPKSITSEANLMLVSGACGSLVLALSSEFEFGSTISVGLVLSISKLGWTFSLLPGIFEYPDAGLSLNCTADADPPLVA